MRFFYTWILICLNHFCVALLGSGVAVDQTPGETGGWWGDCSDSWVCPELNARHDGWSEGGDVLSHAKVFLLHIHSWLGLWRKAISFLLLKDLKTKKIGKPQFSCRFVIIQTNSNGIFFHNLMYLSSSVLDYIVWNMWLAYPRSRFIWKNCYNFQILSVASLRSERLDSLSSWA